MKDGDGTASSGVTAANTAAATRRGSGDSLFDPLASGRGVSASGERAVEPAATASQGDHSVGGSAEQRRSSRVPTPLFRLGSACRGHRLSDA